MSRLTLPDLTTKALDAARLLAQEGCREHTIRRALGLTLSQWKALKEDTEAGELSPLALALEEGRAEGAGDIIAFMKKRMGEGSERAAEFLADRVFQLGRGDGNADVPRVAIFIQAAMSPDEYARVIAVQQQPGVLTHER
ncbi:hypothetical protein [Stenotrophomonas muris]|uniref:hypothetical protein n=1 Tax=Stenotrophomonas muris TaxID=2963283 RepID=UPI002E7A1FDA|nr:hypothetical protein [Stenotrophomonas muris]